MTEHTSMQVVEEVEKAMTASDWKRFSDLHADHVVLHSPDNATPLQGREAVVGWYKGFKSSFSDMTPTRTAAISQGEWVAAQYTVTGTNNGPLHAPDGSTIPATHKKVKIPNSSWYKIQNGKIVEVHEYFDQAGYMAQLGLGPK